jgi:curved DNA-binding protein CbpA
MKDRPNYYRILQVQPDALPEIIHASYRTLMKELKIHPDLGGSTAEAALLNEAHETLSDSRRRSAYDEELFHQSIQEPYFHTKPVSPAACPICRQPLSQEPAPGQICPACRTPLKSNIMHASTPGTGRSLERIRVSDRIYYYSGWPGKAKEGRMIDFSPKGMRFIGVETLPLHSVLKISCRHFEASGTVTNVSEEVSSGQKIYSVGVCFLAVQFADFRGTFLSTSA